MHKKIFVSMSSTTRKIDATITTNFLKQRFIYFKAQVFLALMLSDILSNEYYDTHEYYLVCVVKIKCVTVGNTVG